MRAWGCLYRKIPFSSPLGVGIRRCNFGGKYDKGDEKKDKIFLKEGKTKRKLIQNGEINAEGRKRWPKSSCEEKILAYCRKRKKIIVKSLFTQFYHVREMSIGCRLYVARPVYRRPIYRCPLD